MKSIYKPDNKFYEVPANSVKRFIVEASSAAEARILASINAESEGKDYWCDPLLSSCRVVKFKNEPLVLVKDMSGTQEKVQ